VRVCSEMACRMRKSKLELYQEILEGLKSKPLSVDCLSYETGMDCAVLRQRLDFLIKNGLARERVLNKGTLFAISERGLAVLKALDVQKRLEEVKTAMMAVDAAMQTGITVPKQRRKNE
jgi:predicted transcriptional regulator